MAKSRVNILFIDDTGTNRNVFNNYFSKMIQLTGADQQPVNLYENYEDFFKVDGLKELDDIITGMEEARNEAGIRNVVSEKINYAQNQPGYAGLLDFKTMAKDTIIFLDNSIEDDKLTGK